MGADKEIGKRQLLCSASSPMAINTAATQSSRAVISGQRHDVAGAHRDIAAAPQMGDKASAAAVALTGFGANDTHDLAIELELHVRLRPEAADRSIHPWQTG
jgi:hypothetical protein